LISDMVRKKLEELGLIEIKSIKPRPKKSDTEKAMKTIHPFTPREKAVKGQAKPPRPALETFRCSEEGSQLFSSLPLHLGEGGEGPAQPPPPALGDLPLVERGIPVFLKPLPAPGK